MSDLGNIDDDQPVGEDGENTSKKSERKRQREKQRRSDLANAFDELANLLSRIEPDDLDASSNSRRRRRRNSADDGAEAEADAAGMTRLDLIGRTVDALRRLHRENVELRQALDQQRRSASALGSNEDKEVLVMVPTLTPSDSQAQSGQYQPYYSHPQQSARYHPSQEYHQQPQPPMGFYSSGPSQYDYGGYAYQQPPPPPPPPPQPWNHQGSMQPPQHHLQPPPPPVPPGQMVGYHSHHSGPPHHQHHGHPGGPTPSPTSARGEGN